MIKSVHYTLFAEPISRRTIYWVLFLCPSAALWIYLASRRVTGESVADAVTAVS